MEDKPKIVAIVQARLGSTRLRNKIISKIGSSTAIELLLNQLSYAQYLNDICIAFPDTPEHRALGATKSFQDVKVSFGDEFDVYERFLKASKECNADVIVRITADCPLIDPEIVDSVVRLFLESKNVIITSNSHPPRFPDGLDCEVIKAETLVEFQSIITDKSDREHVTSYFYRTFPKLVSNFENLDGSDYSQIRLTLDEKIDLEVINSVIREIGSKTQPILLNDILKVWESKPQLFQNNTITRNSGFSQSSGKKLYGKAKTLIPGASMLFSKRAENFHPEDWPAYYTRAKGIRIWDLDNNEFRDFSLMGVGANSLGYANEEIDDAVVSAIRSSVSSTLINRREVELAEEIVQLHEEAEMVRFTRTGGEASAVAIRIARAHTGRDRIVFCGYHGWHDFYLSANLDSDTALRDVLMPGLASAGVPRSLGGTSIPFKFNDYESFDTAIKKGDVAAVIMEVQRNTPPISGFLEHVKRVTREQEIVLIFDECSSGFRETYGGIYKKYQVIPDLLILGKALGNGYAINSVSGPKQIMNAAQDTFISSTSWSESVGFAAALATLKLIKREKSYQLLPKIGEKVREIWVNSAQKVNLSISTQGIDAMPNFTFEGDYDRTMKTLFTQYMLDRGFLASNSFYASTAHSSLDIEDYQKACYTSFEAIAEAKDSNKLSSALNGRPAHAHFSRLN